MKLYLLYLASKILRLYWSSGIAICLNIITIPLQFFKQNNAGEDDSFHIMPSAAKLCIISTFLKQHHVISLFFLSCVCYAFVCVCLILSEIQCTQKDILVFKRPFLGSNQVKCTRIAITHVCFIALTLARILE